MGAEVGASPGRRPDRQHRPALDPGAYDRSSGFIGQRVNARTDPPEELSGRETSPGVLDVFMKTATVSIETLTVDALDYAVNRQREREQAQANIRTCNEKLTACRGTLLPT